MTPAVAPAKERPHYIPKREADAGKTRCRQCLVRGTTRNRGGRDGTYRHQPRYPVLYLHPEAAA
ncbi:hypothetical protein GCM10027452_24620 [Micromonospora halotolerans]